ncbi:ankyrin repeat-containing domain protein [Nemania sp. FL0031]|nr:ankyrin repeat-containing domain protein [Nemania sp. FL0031]
MKKQGRPARPSYPSRLVCFEIFNIADRIDGNGKFCRTPLSYATNGGSEAVVKLLLRTSGADADSRDNDGQTPLLHAAKNGRETVIQALLWSHADPHLKDNWRKTPTMVCCLSRPGSSGKSAAQIRSGSSQCRRLHLTPESLVVFGFARACGHSQGASGQAKLKADVNSKNKWGQTPLSCAALNEHAPIAKLLLETQAAVKLLLEIGRADIHEEDKYGRVPLSHSAAKGHIAIVKLILETGQADVNSTDEYCQSPLSHAVANRHMSIIRLLLRTSQVDINLNDIFSRSPLLYAIEKKHNAIAQLLQSFGAV